MRNSIATVSVSGSLPEKLRAIAAAGFDAVEIFETDLTASDLSPEAVFALLGDLGLACTALQPFRDFEALPEPLRGRAFARAERKFDLMQRLGADLLLVCSSVSPMALDDEARRAADLHELGERAARRGISIAYEALAWGRHVYDHRQAWTTVQAADHPAVGLALDSFHSLARGIPVDSLEAIDPSKVFLVQLADAPMKTMDYLSWSRHFRCFPGQGELPVTAFVTALARQGFSGGLSLEIFNDRFRATPPEHIAIDGFRSLTALRDDVRQTLQGSPAALPPRVRCEAIEFVEFAARSEEAQELGALFGKLGFQLTGRHRTKSVTRWSQGDINLVVNSEPESFASAYALVHGASACALGLRIDDVASAQTRASALKINSFHQPANPGDLELPAVVGVGGSVLYFTESKGELADVWSREFVASEPIGKIADVGLARIDSLAQTLHSDDVLSWRLFYSTLFEGSTRILNDIPDPSGLVHSTRIEVAGDALRLNLSEPQGRETLGARFLNRFFGSGLQHITFNCWDVAASVDAITQAGGEMLSIPPNYYDDLAARFGLSTKEIADLAARNLLYDREESGGELLYAFTRAHQRRFFFELVERRSGYRGVDILGEQVRLAAQARLKPLALP